MRADIFFKIELKIVISIVVIIFVVAHGLHELTEMEQKEICKYSFDMLCHFPLSSVNVHM